MASSSSAIVDCGSSSVLSHSSVPKEYDVFISFRGEDTRVGFTSHLHAALCRNNIRAFIDDNMQKGEQVWVQLLKAIKESTLFLVILSENYACSSWCLNELVELMECKKQEEEDVHVIPVFYKVDPSHVRKHKGSYHAATPNQKWMDALKNAANLSGFHSIAYRTETDLIEGIIKAVSEKLNHKYTINDFTGPFIYDENYTNIESSLKINSKKVQVIGIWGMGGIGKTSLAAAIFHNVFSQYQGTCFLANVAEESKKHGLNYLCKKLFSDLLEEELHIDNAQVIPNFVTRRLECKKVFIVLDNVNSYELLENLVGVSRKWLGAGRKVIVTTRDKHEGAEIIQRDSREKVLPTCIFAFLLLTLICGDVDNVHEVKQMNFENSLQLFSFNAFRKTYPEKEYEELSKKAIAYAKGIPLALKVLGSFLRSKSENEWNSALSRLRKSPHAKIQAVLRLSFDELNDDKKNIFLDIACFFKGQERANVTDILNGCGFYVDIGIRSLLDKALITYTAYNKCIDMHDLIQEMGREIVREESVKNPGQRSRLWDGEDVCDVLTNNRGTDAVEVIWLNMTQITNLNLSSKAFRKMPNLRILAFHSINEDDNIVNSVYLPEGLKFLPKNLRYFRWNGYPLKSLPSTFCPEKLVMLSMQRSNVERLWHGVQNLPNLQKIDLGHCKQLVECPNLSGAKNFTCLIFRNGVSLAFIDPSIFSLPKLQAFDVVGCKSQTVEILCLRYSGLNELPPSIFCIKNIQFISLSINDVLVDLPKDFITHRIVLSESSTDEGDSFFILQKALSSPGFLSLRCLVFDECPRLCKIPNNISFLSSLLYLILYHSSAIVSLPESIKYLPRLREVEVVLCKSLQCIPALPQSIQRLLVGKCESLHSVLCSTIEPSKNPEYICLLPNCVKLDEHTCDAILKDAIVRIELAAKPPSAQVLGNEQDNCLAESTKICYSLPATSGKVLDWFHWLSKSAQALVPIEQLPPNLLGFIFYLVVSPCQSRHVGCCASIGCECYLETNEGERIKITSFFLDKNVFLFHPAPLEFITDHIFLWYDGKVCKQILEIIKERKASDKGDPKLTFKFFTETRYDKEAVIIKECGFRWIYSVEEEGCKSNRSGEGSESSDQEETLPPVNSGTSNLEAEEVEELRHRLEKLSLHSI